VIETTFAGGFQVNFLKKFFVLGISCFILTFLPACGSNETPHPGTPGVTDTIKVVSSLPRTGTSNAQTSTIVNGIKMAFEEVGYKVGSFTIKYEDWDDASAKLGKWDPEVESQNADRAIKDFDVIAYIGTYNSGAAKISMPRLNKAGLLMISPGNTAVGLTKPGKGEKGEPEVYRPSGKITYFRVVPADDIQAPFAAHWAKKLNFKKVFVLNDREVYGKGIADLFDKECRNIGIEVLGNEGIDSKQLEYRGMAVKIKDLNPDLIYFGGITDSNPGQLIKDLRAVGVNAPLMVPDGCREEAFLESAGVENLNGKCYVTFGGLPPDKLTGKGADFYKSYKEKFKSEPEAYAIYGYECGKIVIEAVKRAGSKDRDKIIEACRGIKDFEGAMGKWSFDENGDTTISIMTGEIVKNGKFEFASRLTMDADGTTKPATTDEKTEGGSQKPTAPDTADTMVPTGTAPGATASDSTATPTASDSTATPTAPSGTLTGTAPTSTTPSVSTSASASTSTSVSVSTSTSTTATAATDPKSAEGK